MKIGKKGIAASEMWAPDTIIFWLIFGIVLGITAIFFILIVAKIGTNQAQISDNIESLFLMQRFFKSSSCFAYLKENVLLNGAIDADKFSEERLNDCYKVNEKTMPAFRLTLSLDSATIFKTIKTSNWNDNRPSEEKEAPKNVIVYFQEKPYNGDITIEIQNNR